MTQPLAAVATTTEPVFRDIVRMEGVQKYFGAVQALRDISLRIGKNEIVGTQLAAPERPSHRERDQQLGESLTRGQVRLLNRQT